MTCIQLEGTTWNIGAFFQAWSGVPILTGFISTPGDASPDMAPFLKNRWWPVPAPFLQLFDHSGWSDWDQRGFKEHPIAGLAYEIGVLSLKTKQQVPKAFKNWPRPIDLVALRPQNQGFEQSLEEFYNSSWGLLDLSCWENLRNIHMILGYVWFFFLPRRAFFIQVRDFADITKTSSCRRWFPHWGDDCGTLETLHHLCHLCHIRIISLLTNSSVDQCGTLW